jgi:hypothetical protein
MRLLRNTPFWLTILLLSLDLLGAVARGNAQINAGALHIASGTTWVSTPQTAVVLDNTDLQYDASPSWLLNNSFRFTGTTNSAIGGNSQPYVYAISVAKTSPAKLYLTTQINIAKRINFQSGLFDLNSLYIVLADTALLTNESETSRIYGDMAGGVQIFAALNGPVNANPGNLGLILSSPTSLGNVTITRAHVPRYVNFTGYSVARYYDVSPAANVDNNTTLRFTYFDAELNGLPEDSLGLWESQDATFSPLGFTARNATLNYVEKHGLTQPGRFTLYTYDTTATAPPPIDSTAPPPIDSTAPPPADTTKVHVVLFGSWIHDWASLSWVVSPANVTDHLVVERKYSNESSFTAITSIPALSTGTTPAAGVAYDFTDSTVKTGPYDVSYRINEVGTDGSSVYSNIVTLTATSSEGFILKLYPTIAVGGQVYIKAGNMAIDKMQLQVFDSRGGLVMSGTLPYVSQWLSVAPLARGVYRLSLRSASNKFIGTFIK